MKRMSLRTTLTGLVLAGLALLLAGCGTTAINQQAMAAHQEALMSQRLAMEQHAGRCATSSAVCQHDTNPGLCAVAVELACGQSAPSMAVSPPQLRSPGDEFARGFGPIANLASTGLQVWGAGWLVDRSGRNAADLVGAVGGLVGQVQGPVDNSVSVGGNWGDTRGHEIGGDQIGGDRIDDRSTGRDRIGRDQRIGDDIRDSCVGDRCRNESPGPIDNSTNNPPPDDPGDPGGG